MFEKIFTQRLAIERYRTAPLVEQRLRYLQYCGEYGATLSTLRKAAWTQLCLIPLLNLTKRDRLTVSQVKAGIKKSAHPSSSRDKAEFISVAIRWLRFLGWLEEPVIIRHSYTAEVVAFKAWMREQRGWSEATIHSNCVAADEFFDWLTCRDFSLQAITISTVDQFIMYKTSQRHYSRVTIANHVGRLRAFFRFAEGQSRCMPGIAAGLKSPWIYRDASVPKGLSRDNVRRLLATTEGDKPVDKRDRAILMLLINYGLRSGEIRSLQLNDLDWERETVRVYRSKTGRTDLYPLSSGVGGAILRYILEVRPSQTERTLFLTLLAPLKPLSRGGLYHIVGDRLKRLGIVTGHRGPHGLRHAAAQHLLDQGMSMKVIGDYMGHSNASSTAVYAKVNLKALREVADFDLEVLI